MFKKLRNAYHNASEWTHHHSAVFVLWLTMCAGLFGSLLGSVQTFAAGIDTSVTINLIDSDGIHATFTWAYGPLLEMNEFYIYSSSDQSSRSMNFSRFDTTPYYWSRNIGGAEVTLATWYYYYIQVYDGSGNAVNSNTVQYNPQTQEETSVYIDSMDDEWLYVTFTWAHYDSSWYYYVYQSQDQVTWFGIQMAEYDTPTLTDWSTTVGGAMPILNDWYYYYIQVFDISGNAVNSNTVQFNLQEQEQTSVHIDSINSNWVSASFSWADGATLYTSPDQVSWSYVWWNPLGEDYYWPVLIDNPTSITLITGNYYYIEADDGNGGSVDSNIVQYNPPVQEQQTSVTIEAINSTWIHASLINAYGGEPMNDFYIYSSPDQAWRSMYTSWFPNSWSQYWSITLWSAQVTLTSWDYYYIQVFDSRWSSINSNTVQYNSMSEPDLSGWVAFEPSQVTVSKTIGIESIFDFAAMNTPEVTFEWPITIGKMVPYTITIQNNSNKTLDNFVIKDFAPEGMILVWDKRTNLTYVWDIREYGVVGDSCYDDLLQNQWLYWDALDDISTQKWYDSFVDEFYASERSGQVTNESEIWTWYANANNCIARHEWKEEDFKWCINQLDNYHGPSSNTLTSQCWLITEYLEEPYYNILGDKISSVKSNSESSRLFYGYVTEDLIDGSTVTNNATVEYTVDENSYTDSAAVSESYEALWEYCEPTYTIAKQAKIDVIDIVRETIDGSGTQRITITLEDTSIGSQIDGNNSWSMHKWSFSQESDYVIAADISTEQNAERIELVAEYNHTNKAIGDRVRLDLWQNMRFAVQQQATSIDSITAAAIDCDEICTIIIPDVIYSIDESSKIEATENMKIYQEWVGYLSNLEQAYQEKKRQLGVGEINMLMNGWETQITQDKKTVTTDIFPWLENMIWSYNIELVNGKNDDIYKVEWGIGQITTFAYDSNCPICEPGELEEIWYAKSLDSSFEITALSTTQEWLSLQGEQNRDVYISLESTSVWNIDTYAWDFEPIKPDTMELQAEDPIKHPNGTIVSNKEASAVSLGISLWDTTDLIWYITLSVCEKSTMQTAYHNQWLMLLGDNQSATDWVCAYSKYLLSKTEDGVSLLQIDYDVTESSDNLVHFKDTSRIQLFDNEWNSSYIVAPNGLNKSWKSQMGEESTQSEVAWFESSLSYAEDIIDGMWVKFWASSEDVIDDIYAPYDITKASIITKITTCSLWETIRDVSNKKSNNSRPLAIKKDSCWGFDKSLSLYDGFCDKEKTITENNKKKDIVDHNSAEKRVIDIKKAIPTTRDVIEEMKRFSPGTIASTEEVQAYMFAKTAGITTKDSFEEADPQGVILRWDFAKMIVTFAENILGLKPNESRRETCNEYADSNLVAGTDLEEFITRVCMHRIMGLDNDAFTPMASFNPFEVMNRAMIVTTLSRMIDQGKTAELYEPQENYRTAHMASLLEKWVITVADPTLIDKRINALIMLMRQTEKEMEKK